MLKCEENKTILMNRVIRTDLTDKHEFGRTKLAVVVAVTAAFREFVSQINSL